MLLNRADLDGKVVLDAGIGGGAMLRLLLDSPAKEIISVDVDHQRFAQTCEQLSAEGVDYSRVRITLADLAKPLPLPTESVDVVTASFTLSAIEQFAPRQLLAVLVNLRRVLKPHGLFFCRDYSPFPPKTVIGEFWQLLGVVQGICGKSYLREYSASEITTMLNLLGLEVVSSFESAASQWGVGEAEKVVTSNEQLLRNCGRYDLAIPVIERLKVLAPQIPKARGARVFGLLARKVTP